MAAPATRRKPRLAAVVTEYRYYSHADVVCGRIFDGYAVNGKRVEPRTEIVSLYTAQIPENDMSRELASRHGIPIYPTIADALTLGTGRLAVDGVIFIGEHGNYPYNELGQKLYPRFELFQQVLDVYRASGRVVPTFFDKHLSYDWGKAKQISDAVKEMKIPFLAGSSIPVTLRQPELVLPAGRMVEKTCMVGYGETDAYGFHLLETNQTMVERRKKTEPGIAAVRMLEGPAVWAWRDGEGAWSQPLYEAALQRLDSSAEREAGKVEELVKKPVLFHVEYRDGLQSCIYILNGLTEHWSFASQLAGSSEIQTTYYNQGFRMRPLPHFDGLVHCIEELMVTKKSPYPHERTLLATGALCQLFESKRRGNVRVETPMLQVNYMAAADWHQTK
jgi:hypothetical protein